ncbi:MAG: LuxR C-terminal-related transcriptional regulator [Pseudomonadota bacterium]
MTTDQPAVLILDDDAAVREGLTVLLDAGGRHAFAASDLPEAITALKAMPARTVILADVNLQEETGFSLPEAMAEAGLERPIVYMSAYASLDMAKSALRNQAVDFLEKPFDWAELQAALVRAAGAFAAPSLDDATRCAAASLTPREQEVLALLVEGCASKIIARRLDISVRTVDVHRSRLLAKLGARNVQDLVRIGLAVGMGTSAAT